MGEIAAASRTELPVRCAAMAWLTVPAVHRWPARPEGLLMVRCCGKDRRGRTGLYAPNGRGYGTGAGRSAYAAASDVHGFPDVLTSLIGRSGPVREVVGLVDERRLVTMTRPAG